MNIIICDMCLLFQTYLVILPLHLLIQRGYFWSFQKCRSKDQTVEASVEQSLSVTAAPWPPPLSSLSSSCPIDSQEPLR